MSDKRSTQKCVFFGKYFVQQIIHIYRDNMLEHFHQVTAFALPKQGAQTNELFDEVV